MSAQKSERAVTRSLGGVWSGMVSDVPLGLGIPRMCWLPVIHVFLEAGCLGCNSFCSEIEVQLLNRNSQMAQWQRILLPMQEMLETRVQSLGGEDLVEEGMATNSSILAWRIPWTEEPGGPVCGVTKSWTELK